MKRRFWKEVITILILILGVTHLKAQTKIAVIADPHVMGPGLLIADGSAWQTTLQNDRKLLDYSRTVFDILMERMLEEKPDLLLMPGDMTKDGETVSHEYVTAKLDLLRDAGIRTLVIPGNHDLGTNFSLYFNGGSTSAAETVGSSQFAEMYREYGYGADSERDPNSLSYSCEPVEGLVLIGIDSGFYGELSEATIDWVCSQAEQARSNGKQVIAMMHYALFPHYEDEERIMEYSVVTDYENVRNRFVNAGIGVVLTGHIHVSDIAKDYNADVTAQIYDISTGSPVSYPCDYRMMTLSADLQRLTVTTEHIATLPDEDDFKQTAKKRLKNTMLAWINEDITKNELVSDLMADVFVVHAEGNENESDEADNINTMFSVAKAILGADETLQQRLAKLGVTWESASTIMNSILQDITYYGNTERENRVNDLTVTIDLSAINEPTGIKTVTATGLDSEDYYSLQGVKTAKPAKGLYVKKGKVVVVR